MWHNGNDLKLPERVQQTKHKWKVTISRSIICQRYHAHCAKTAVAHEYRPNEYVVERPKHSITVFSVRNWVVFLCAPVVFGRPAPLSGCCFSRVLFLLSYFVPSLMFCSFCRVLFLWWCFVRWNSLYSLSILCIGIWSNTIDWLSDAEWLEIHQYQQQ